MSQWQGFDQRKVCPKCDGYQTWYFKDKNQQNSLEASIIILVSLFIAFIATGALALLFISQYIRGHTLNPGLIFPFLFLLISISFNQGLKNGLKICCETIIERILSSEKNNTENITNGEEAQIVYHLHCLNCDYEWEKTIDEWEQEGQNELSKERLEK